MNTDTICMIGSEEGAMTIGDRRFHLYAIEEKQIGMNDVLYNPRTNTIRHASITDCDDLGNVVTSSTDKSILGRGIKFLDEQFVKEFVSNVTKVMNRSQYMKTATEAVDMLTATELIELSEYIQHVKSKAALAILNKKR